MRTSTRRTIARRLPDSGQAGRAFERVVTVTLLLLLSLEACAICLEAFGVLPRDAWGLPRVFHTEVIPIPSAERMLLRLLFALGAGVLALGLVWLAFQRAFAGSRSRYIHVVSADEQGLVVVGSRGVESVALTAIHTVRGVVDARVAVRGRIVGPVKLAVTLWVSAAGDLPRIGDAAREAARDAVTRLAGIDVDDVSVRVVVVRVEEIARAVR